MTRKKISFTDHAWLRMDEPDNLMVITGLITFETPLDYEALKTIVENSLLPIRRFRQRIKPPLLPFMRPYWEDDPNFDLESHLERVKLPPPADQKTLQDLIIQLMSTKLETTRPLWQFYLVENYGKGSAFIARLHHSIADGITLMQVLISLTDTNPASSHAGQLQEIGRSEQQTISGPKNTAKSAVLKSEDWTVENLWKEGVRILTNPSHARYRVHQVIDLAATVGKLTLRWPDPKTVFKGSLGIEKCAAWSEPISLRDVKHIRKAFNCTVNDVLLTAVAGALGHYVESHKQETEDVSIRGFIPVNLRPIQLDQELGNKFGLVFLSVPIGIDDPIKRLQQVRQNMDALKASSEAIATFVVLNLFGAVSDRLEDVLVDFFGTKGSAVITNVPGPQTQRYLAGTPINSLMAWVPQSGRLALGISIISYNGKVWLGVATDKGLIPDPETIIDFFDTEFNELKYLAQIVHAERQKKIQPMLSKLDDAIQTLDEILALANKE